MLNLYIKEESLTFIQENIYILISINFFDLVLKSYLFLIFFLSNLLFLLKNYFYWKFNPSKININHNTIEIVRIEDEAGVGPYRSLDKKILEHFNLKTQPSPITDFKNIWIDLQFSMKYKKFKFAFKDKKQLENWFSKEEIKEVLKNGYKIKKYIVKDYYISQHQLIFKTIIE